MSLPTTSTLTRSNNNTRNWLTYRRKSNIASDQYTRLVESDIHHSPSPSKSTSSSTSTSISTTSYIVSETNEFRAFADSGALLFNESDRILEIGSSTGQATKLLLHTITSLQPPPPPHAPPAAAPLLIGLEVSKTMRATSLTNLSALSYPSNTYKILNVNVLQNPHLLKETAQMFGFSGTQRLVVFVDIGGNRDCKHVLKVINDVEALNPRVIIVKCRELCSHFNDGSSDGDGDGDGDGGGRSGSLCMSYDEIVERVNSSLIRNPRVNKKALKRKNETNDGIHKSEEDKDEDDGDNLPFLQPKSKTKTLHPLKAPHRSNPKTGLSICRYYNYGSGKTGCRKGERGECEFDHEVCHVCLEVGHRALECCVWLNC